MTPEEREILFHAAEWATHSKRTIMSKLREVAVTEENYLIIARELDRVHSERLRARSLHVDATLTLLDWIKTLDYFEWRCAYCQEKPFQIMSHYIPLPCGGTTPTNCVPACYSCMKRKEKRNNARVLSYLSQA